MERLVKFELLGQEYPLYTDASEEEIEEILNLVKMQIENQSKSFRGVLPANKVAVLTSLNMAGKYVSLKRDFEQHKKEMTERVERLTSVIKSSLPHDMDYQVKKSESERVDKLSQVTTEGYDRV